MTQNRYGATCGFLYAHRNGLVGGAQQQNTAIVPNLPNWEWNPMDGLAQAIPSCDGTPGGLILFGGDIPSYPLGPGPHQNDAGLCDGALQSGQLYVADGPGWCGGGAQWAMCQWASPGQTYTVNYTDANGCPGYMEAVVPQVPLFYAGDLAGH